MKKINLGTPIVNLHEYGVAGLSKKKSLNLALAVSNFIGKTDARQTTIEDLLFYLPMRWEDRSNLVKIRDLRSGMQASLDLYVRVSGGYKVGKSRSFDQSPLYIFEISASDAEGTCKPVIVWWFVSGKKAEKVIEYYQSRFQRGTRFVAYGKWEWDHRRATFSLRIGKPDELEILPSDTKANFGLFTNEDIDSEKELDETIQFPMIHTARRVPVYRKLGQFQTKTLREIVFDVLQKLENVQDKLPKEILKRNNLIPLDQAYREIHFPPEDSDLAEYERARSRAHLRLIFEEFFWISFCLQLRQMEGIREKKETRIFLTDSIREKIFSILPFEPTAAQKKAVEEIFADMVSDKPMNRLVQGDVGSGKTIVAILAMLLAVENGYQAALMAPTEILAEQHAGNIKKLIEGKLPYKVKLLVGSLKATEKRKLHREIAKGEIDIVVGTHALIQEDVRFAKLGIAVIDEQHRFGVLQRAELQTRGYNIDTLVMTATPIPRSLAMTIYSGLDVSIIDELPPGRTPVKTVVLGEDKREGVYKGIAREIELGRQVYIVYPLIEESEKVDLKAATEMYERLKNQIFPQYKIGLLHGKMKPSEKEAVMRDFVSGRLQILVSTTVIEVGVDVPNASLMVIEHAERFGLSQLHQLRGRVGRGASQSYCVLMTSDKKTEAAKQRLGIMEETCDGFRIAEKDLEIRGPGDILGTKQSGLPEFRIGNLARDLEILERAKKEASHYLSENKLDSEAQKMIEAVKSNPRFKLAGIS